MKPETKLLLQQCKYIQSPWSNPVELAQKHVSDLHAESVNAVAECDISVSLQVHTRHTGISGRQLRDDSL